MAAVSLSASAVDADSSGGSVDVGACHNVFVCTGAKVSGSGKRGADSRPSGEADDRSRELSARAEGCTGGAKKDSETGNPCYVEGVGSYDPSSHCYWQLADPQPPAGDPAWEGHKLGDGAVYQRSCGLSGAFRGVAPLSALVWKQTSPADVTDGPSAAELAQEALSKMRLAPVVIGSAPPAGSKGLVGMPVWLWVERSANGWGPITTTASAGGLSVTATAKVMKVVWDMGDGSTVTCTGPGTPYKKAYGKKDSPDCGHRYETVSAKKPGAAFRITATSSWGVVWAATNGESGALPVQTRTATTTARIGELQVVN